MTEYIFGGFLPGFVKPIHIELPDKTVDISMPEIFRQNNFFELFNIFDDKLFSIGQPFNITFIVLMLHKYGNTLIISNAFWTKFATVFSDT